MKPIKRIMIGVDRSELDPTLIRYGSFICSNTKAEEIYFINILKNFDIPEEVKKEFPGLIQNAVDERTAQIREDIEKNFRVKRDVNKHIIVKQASGGTRVMLGAVEKYEIDLLILGRKRKLSGSGILTQRMARRVGTNLLIIPEGSEKKLDPEPQKKRLLVPVDFSHHSELALEQAIDIASRMNEDVEIICLNVYRIPAGYHYTGKSYEEFGKLMKQHAQSDYKRFINQVDLSGIDVRAVYTLNKHDDDVRHIYEFALAENVDGIIFGAKGRTSASALFLGSNAEKMIKLDTEFPLLVVRKGGESAGFMDYIRDI